MKRRFVPQLAILLATLVVGCSLYSVNAPDPRTQREVSYLIRLFDRPDLRLVLNNEEFTGEGAVRIMQSKYDYYQSDIHSAEDFILLCATTSSASGNQMIVKTRKGDHPLNEWLANKLDMYRRHNAE
jgi:Family of unknown function (DUF5329)